MVKVFLGTQDPRVEKFFQACYVGWLDQQLSGQIKDPFRFAYEATEREMGRRQAWPAVHAMTVGFFAGLVADVLVAWTGAEADVFPGHWAGSLPALIVGAIVYVVQFLFSRMWNQRLDYHLAMAIESNETKRRSKNG